MPASKNVPTGDSRIVGNGGTSWQCAFGIGEVLEAVRYTGGVGVAFDANTRCERKDRRSFIFVLDVDTHIVDSDGLFGTSGIVVSPLGADLARAKRLD